MPLYEVEGSCCCGPATCCDLRTLGEDHGFTATLDIPCPCLSDARESEFGAPGVANLAVVSSGAGFRIWGGCLSDAWSESPCFESSPGLALPVSIGIRMSCTDGVWAAQIEIGESNFANTGACEGGVIVGNSKVAYTGFANGLDVRDCGPPVRYSFSVTMEYDSLNGGFPYCGTDPFTIGVSVVENP